MRKLILLSLLLGVINHGFAQQDFSTIYRNTDLARDSTNPETKIRLHKEFLHGALTRQDTFQAILGNMYLSTDYTIKSDYPSATSHLVEAGNFAAAIRDTLLLGRVNHKKGAVFTLLQDYQEALTYYKTALGQSEIAQDSYYIAISLEQLGRIYADLNEYDESNEYYRQAIPMVEKHCPPYSLSTTLINYGNSLDKQDSARKAIQVYKRAIQIGEEIQNEYETVPAKQNLAFMYAKYDSLEKALELYWECKRSNEQNGWLAFLIYSYEGLGLTHEKIGNPDSSLFYYRKFYQLKDSVIGTEVQSRVKQLEATNEMQKKDIDLLQQKERTLLQKQYTRTISFIAIMLLSALGSGLWLSYRKQIRTKRRLQENRESLHQLAKLLESKNAELRDLRIQSDPHLRERNEPEEELLKEINIYDLSILTDEDWHTFKTLFEKAYPNFLIKIRRSFPRISEAEERMFIFIKLQLSNKESANIIGVQPETIKKTRSRLRKRIGLTKTDNLNEFVHNFD